MTAAAGARTYLNPQGFIYGTRAAEALAANDALPLGSTGFAFTQCEILVREKDGVLHRQTVAVPDLAQHTSDADIAAVLERTISTRARLRTENDPGLTFERPLVMAIVNVTPDSFSGDGVAGDVAAAVALGRRHIEAGADVLDIGGESTRPGATPVETSEECDRVLPVITALKDEGVPISVDTRCGQVMTAAVQAGATIINDVSALTSDPESLDAAAACTAAVVLNHMRGTPQTMQNNPTYDNVVLDVFDDLETRVEAAITAGISRERLIVDPGLGFGKTRDHNLKLLANLALFQGLGCPVLIGASRKSFVGATAGSAATPTPTRTLTPADRLPGSLAAVLAAVRRGVNMVRVHDVAATCQALAVARAIDSEY